MLARRTRISIETWDRGVAAAEPAAPSSWRGMLGWDDAQRPARGRAPTASGSRAERESQTMPDDRSADEARLKATDLGA